MKKYINIMVVVVLLFSFVIIQPQKVAANPLVLGVPAGITVGAGAYSVGAWALAGTLGLAGYAENADAINAHAAQVWESSTELSKASINYAIEQAYKAGNGLVTLGQDYWDWALPGLEDMATFLSSFAQADSGWVDNNIRYSFPTGGGDLTKSMGVISGKQLISVNGVKTAGFSIKRSYGHTSADGTRWNALIVSPSIGGNSSGQIEFDWNSEMVAKFNAINSLADMKSFLAAAGYSVSVQILSPDISMDYNHVKQRLTETWETVRDAGLVLPINDAVPYAGGQRLTYNPATDTYSFPSGQIFDGSTHGPIDWAFPTPKIVKDNVTGQDRVVFPTRDAPVGGIGQGIGTGKLTGTWTDVFTGDIVTSDTVPVEGDIPGTGDIPTDVTGFWAKLWEWLQKLLNGILNIPKAILDGLKALFVPAVAISTLFLPIQNVMENKFNQRSDFDFLGGQFGGSCDVNDLYVNIAGKNTKILDMSFVKNASSYYLPIMRGLLWFLFGWYTYRKFISLWNKTGGIKL